MLPSFRWSSSCDWAEDSSSIATLHAGQVGVFLHKECRVQETPVNILCDLSTLGVHGTALEALALNHRKDYGCPGENADPPG